MPYRNEKTIINSRLTYKLLYRTILKCRNIETENKIVMFLNKENIIMFDTFYSYKDTKHQKLLWISKPIDKSLFKTRAGQESIIEEIIRDIEKRNNMYIERIKEIEEDERYWTYSSLYSVLFICTEDKGDRIVMFLNEENKIKFYKFSSYKDKIIQRSYNIKKVIYISEYIEGSLLEDKNRKKEVTENLIKDIGERTNIYIERIEEAEKDHEEFCEEIGEFFCEDMDNIFPPLGLLKAPIIIATIIAMIILFFAYPFLLKLF